MDELEKIIISNRQNFDLAKPNRNLWDRIKTGLPGQNRYLWIWKVATAVLLLTTSFLLYQNYGQEKVERDQLAELEKFYFSQIDYKKTLISESSRDYSGLTEISQDLRNLDAMYMVLKEEWEKKPSKEVLEALSLNLLVRLNLLNRYLEDLQPQEQQERKI